MTNRKSIVNRTTSRLAAVFAVVVLARGTPAIGVETILQTSCELDDAIGRGDEAFCSETDGGVVAPEDKPAASIVA